MVATILFFKSRKQLLNFASGMLREDESTIKYHTSKNTRFTWKWLFDIWTLQVTDKHQMQWSICPNMAAILDLLNLRINLWKYRGPVQLGKPLRSI